MFWAEGVVKAKVLRWEPYATFAGKLGGCGWSGVWIQRAVPVAILGHNRHDFLRC